MYSNFIYSRTFVKEDNTSFYNNVFSAVKCFRQRPNILANMAENFGHGMATLSAFKTNLSPLCPILGKANQFSISYAKTKSVPFLIKFAK
jgi:hypothetical protein